MKYRQPFDQSDPDAHYQNAAPSLGLRGSILDIIAVENLMREIVGTITRAGLTPTDSDLTQLWQATRWYFGNDTGTKNAMVIDLDPPPPALRPGMVVRVKKINEANDDPTTLDIGLGVNDVRRINGALLGDGDLPASTVGTFVWTGAHWQHDNSLGAGGSATGGATGGGTTNNYVLNIPYCEDASPTPNIVVANFSPAITSLAAGDMMKVKLANSVTGPAIIKINGLADLDLVRPDRSALRADDVVDDQIMILDFDGTKVQVINVNPSAAQFIPGVMYPWPTEVAPPYTMECDGRSLSRTTYARLFGIIGTRYGAGDLSTTFNIPDLRGEFLRGWDHGRGVDPDAVDRTNAGGGEHGNHVGTRQPEQLKSHEHVVTLHSHEAQDQYAFLNAYRNEDPFNGFGTNESGPKTHGIEVHWSLTASGGGGNETRPRNVNVMWVIGY